MLLSKIKTYVELRKKRKIADLVRQGIVPQGVSKEAIWDALKVTKKPNQTEMFGFLSAKIYDKHGNLKQDLGLQSVKEITTAFANLLVDGLCDSSVCADFDHFVFHQMGAGSTAETDTETALVDKKGNGATGSQTHGASSNIFESVKTMTATSSFGCREHGIFNAETGGTMLDRSVVTNIALNTDDEVAWTYDLTVNAGG